MSENGTPQHQYPHQIASDVSPADLATDVEAHPEDYPEALMPHIKAHLAKTGLDEVVTEPLPKRSPDEILAILAQGAATNLGMEDAEKLIDAGQCFSVAEHLDKFMGLDYAEIANRMIDAGKGEIVRKALDKFKELDSSIAEKLIDAGWGFSVAEHLDKFMGLDYAEIANRIIDGGYGLYVVHYLDKFTGLDHVTLANRLIDAHLGIGLVSYIDKLTGITLDAVANRMIDIGDAAQIDDLLRNTDKLTNHLDSSIAERLFDAGYGSTVARYLNKFIDLNRNIAQKLIDAGGGRYVAQHLDKFTNLDGSLAEKLIDAREGYYVAQYLDKFTGLDYAAIANRIIDTGQYYAFAENLNKFTNLDGSLAEKLIYAGFGHAVAFNLDKFANLGSIVGEKLTDAGYGGMVVANLDKFAGLDQVAVAKQMIDSGDIWTVANNLSKFTDLDSSIAEKLIDSGQIWFVVDNLDKFAGLDKVAVAKQLIDSGDLVFLIQKAQGFGETIVSQAVLASLDIIQASDDISDSVVENFATLGLAGQDAFTVLEACCTHYSTAQKVKQLNLVELLGEEGAEELLNHIATIKPEIDSVRNDNPYEDTAGDMEHVTSTRPGQEVHKRAVEISKLLRERVGEYKEYAEKAEHAYEALRAQLAQQHDQAYADRLFGPDNGFGSMWPTYRRLVADFLALGDEVSITNMNEVLRNANDSFLQVLRIDKDYYDKLYTEWDAKQIGQREFQEVFLGRDGVYAYVGRRAQMLARQRDLGLRGSQHDEEKSFYNLPTYLVYPRGFRDALDETAKSVYLEQHIPNPKAAHYYDTGFTGTIPEDIMRVLGVPREDWEERIRLLSASKRDRTVLGLEGTKSERDQIVNSVEYHVKDEESAEGLYRDGQDGERLQPYARPTDPVERLAFRFSQLALHRHYYSAETAALHEATIRFDAQAVGTSREMRVRQGYNTEAVDQLRDLFTSNNIGSELLSRATSLKIANPEDPYPDEAVFELPNPSGNLIVKSVVPEKQQGPIDEFEALLLLERLGVDAPRAIARIFTDEQKGFVVMEKLGGSSGRTIKRYFEEHGVAEDNRREILADALERMQSIAETVRRDTGLDKPWRLKDFMIEYETDTTGHVKIASMKPIDFERSKVFDPNDPHTIQLGQDLDALVAS